MADAHLVRPYDLAVITHIIANALSALVGVALMGQAKGNYMFLSHLKWNPAIALGYGESILVHIVDQYVHILCLKILEESGRPTMPWTAFCT